MFKRIIDAMFPKLERSSTFPLSAWAKYLAKYGLNGRTYGVQGRAYNTEGPANDYESYAVRFYKSNSVVWATASVRRRVFSQITFKFRPRDSANAEHSLVDSRELDILDHPAPGRGTSWMLSRAIQDIDIAGNSYWIKERLVDGSGFGLRRLRPDWVDIILSAPPEEALQSDVVGYAYYPGGGTSDPYIFLVEEVCHWAPDPDPEAQYRGMSPMTALWRDLIIEESANEHRISFFKRGAQPNFAVVMKERHTEEQLDAIQARFEATHVGSMNAYQPLFISAGADIMPVETNVSDLDMKNISGRAETHIANVFGVHPAVVGLSEGMQGSSLNAGNYKVTARGFINQTMHPLWQSFCEAMENLVRPPAPTRRRPERLRLWYSSADVSILNDDRDERAEIRGKDAETVDKLVREGWTPESAVNYVMTGDLTKLKHTGLVSVQLYEPGAVPDQGSNLAPKSNGSDNAPSGKPPVPNVDPKAKEDNNNG